jgi:hypothetical protein
MLLRTPQTSLQAQLPLLRLLSRLLSMPLGLPPQLLLPLKGQLTKLSLTLPLLSQPLMLRFRTQHSLLLGNFYMALALEPTTFSQLVQTDNH